MKRTVDSRLTLTCPTAADTERLGFLIGSRVSGGSVVALYGELGVGKTVFVKGLARALGVRETITSPTFIIAAHHHGRLDLFHVDAYRLEGATDNDILQVGLPEMMRGDGVCTVEWAEHVQRWLPEERIDIRMFYDGAGRVIEIEARGEQFADWIEEVLASANAGD